jgi:hypothetical protein
LFVRKCVARAGYGANHRIDPGAAASQAGRDGDIAPVNAEIVLLVTKLADALCPNEHTNMVSALTEGPEELQPGLARGACQKYAHEP